MTLNVYNRQGESVGTVDVDPAEFGGKVNKQLLHDVVLQYLANQRAGTHSTLRRGEVAGSTKKLFRQKGTGNARAGTKRTNKRRGGGTAKGPKPRDYEYHMPKKMVRAATRMAILSKFQDNEAVILDDLTLTEVKTKQVTGVLKSLTKALEPKPAAGQEAEKKPQDEAAHLADRHGRRRQERLYVGSQHPRRGSAAGRPVQRVYGAAAEAAGADQGGAGVAAQERQRRGKAIAGRRRK